MIYFATLDHAEPSGGVRVVYAMVDALNSAGLEAAVWHATPGFRAAWFEHRTRVVHGARQQLDVGDILVMPEIGGARYEHLTRGARVVILNQAHFYTLAGADWKHPDASPYPGWPNCVAVVATSRAIERFVLALVQDRIPVLATAVPVDQDFFVETAKERLITVLSGRRADQVTSLAHLLDRSTEMPEGWRLEVVGGLQKQEMVSMLAKSAIFVSTADRDGFSLPGAEALAAGCDVVGFDGDGAREYLQPGFATRVDDPDLVGLRDAVVAAAREFDEDPEEYRLRRTAGRDFIRENYSQAAFATRAAELFRDLVGRGCGQTRPVTVVHMYAPPRHRDRLPPWVRGLARTGRHALPRAQGK